MRAVEVAEQLHVRPPRHDGHVPLHGARVPHEYKQRTPRINQPSARRMDGAYVFLIVLASWIGISLSVAAARGYSRTRRPPEPEEDSDVQMFIFKVAK